MTVQTRQARILGEANDTDSALLEELWLNGRRGHQALQEKTQIRSSAITKSLKRMIESGTIHLDGTDPSMTKSVDPAVFEITEWGKFCFLRDADLDDPELSLILVEQFNREPIYGAFFRQHLGEWLQDALEALSTFVDAHYPGSLRQAAVTQFFFMCIAGAHREEAEKLMHDGEVRSVSREWLQEIRDRALVLLAVLERIESGGNSSHKISAYQ